MWRRQRGRTRWEWWLGSVGVRQRSVCNVPRRTIVTVCSIATECKIVSRCVRGEVGVPRTPVFALSVARRRARVVANRRVVADVWAVATELDLCNNGEARVV